MVIMTIVAKIIMILVEDDNADDWVAMDDKDSNGGANASPEFGAPWT